MPPPVDTHTPFNTKEIISLTSPGFEQNYSVANRLVLSVLLKGSQAPRTCVMMVGGAGCLAHPPITVLNAGFTHHTATMVTGRTCRQAVDNQSEIDEAAGIHRWVGHFFGMTCCKIAKLLFYICLDGEPGLFVQTFAGIFEIKQNEYFVSVCSPEVKVLWTSLFSIRVSPLLDQDHPLDQVHDEGERRRQEEEFQARYRSDPNLARYPVKPQPSEEAMRMLAQVGRVRHQRRHSDVSLANAEPDHLTLRHAGRKSPAWMILCRTTEQASHPGLCRGTHSVVNLSALRQSRQQGLVGPEDRRSLSVDRVASRAKSPHHSPLPQQHLDMNSALKRKPAYESAAQRARTMSKMHVIGSFSSSEDELVTTPEYTSWDEHDSEWLRAMC